MTKVRNNLFSRSAQVGLVATISSISLSPVHAEDFTTSVFMREYNDEQRALILGGMIEGLAQTRDERDGKDPAGAQCIYGWFYEGDETLLKIYAALASNSNSAPVAVVSALANRECGA